MSVDARARQRREAGPRARGGAPRAQKQCRKSPLALPGRALPAARLAAGGHAASEAFHWDERAVLPPTRPARGAAYALVHDCQGYAHYLLATFRGASRSERRFPRCCGGAGPHVALASHNRVGILRRILRTVRDFPAEERARSAGTGAAAAA